MNKYVPSLILNIMFAHLYTIWCKEMWKEMFNENTNYSENFYNWNTENIIIYDFTNYEKTIYKKNNNFNTKISHKLTSYTQYDFFHNVNNIDNDIYNDEKFICIDMIFIFWNIICYVVTNFPNSWKTFFFVSLKTYEEFKNNIANKFIINKLEKNNFIWWPIIEFYDIGKKNYWKDIFFCIEKIINYKNILLIMSQVHDLQFSMFHIHFFSLKKNEL